MNKATLYTNSETKVVADCKEMGYDAKTIAKFVNKKFHHNTSIRTAEGVRKKMVTL